MSIDNIPRNIRYQRKGAGLSIRQMAKKAHISPSFLSDIERGRSRPSLGTLDLIASALGVSISELIDEDHSPVGDDPSSQSARSGERPPPGP